MTGTTSILTIACIAVFAAALSAGLFSLIVTRRPPRRGSAGRETMIRITEPPSQVPRRQPQPGARPNGLQAMIDTIGDGIESGLSGMAGAIVFICEAFIKAFKWIFRIDRY